MRIATERTKLLVFFPVRCRVLPSLCASRQCDAQNDRYVTSMATVLSAKLFSAGFSSSWLSLAAMSIDDAADTLGICRLEAADSFKAEAGTLARVRGRCRPVRLAADGTLRQILFPMRT